MLHTEDSLEEPTMVVSCRPELGEILPVDTLAMLAMDSPEEL